MGWGEAGRGGACKLGSGGIDGLAGWEGVQGGARGRVG